MEKPCILLSCHWLEVLKVVNMAKICCILQDPSKWTHKLSQKMIWRTVSNQVIRILLSVFGITPVLSSQTGCCDWRTSNSLTKLVRSDKWLYPDIKKISFGHQIRQFTADNCPVPEPNNQIGNRIHNTANMRSFGCAVDSNTNSLLPLMHGFDSQNIRQSNISRASYRT